MHDERAALVSYTPGVTDGAQTGTGDDDLPRFQVGALPRHLITTLLGDYWFGRPEPLPCWCGWPRSSACPRWPRGRRSPDWPRGAARDVFVEVYDTLGPLAEFRVRQIVAEYDP